MKSARRRKRDLHVGPRAKPHDERPADRKSVVRHKPAGRASNATNSAHLNNVNAPVF